MEYKYNPIRSIGDNHLRQFDRLIELLEDGWEIVSAVSDKHKINYILKRKSTELDMDGSE